MAAVDFSTHAVNPTVAGSASATAAAPDEGFSFDDLIDIVNPLQHIPVVSTLYRAITGDTIKTFPKIAGDTLYGGVEGFASSMADLIFTKITGKSFGDTALAMAEDVFSPSKPEATGVADVATPAAPAEASATAPATENLGDRIVDWFDHLFSSHGDTATAVNVTPMVGSVPAPVASPALPAATAAPTPLQTSSAAPADNVVVPGQDALLMALSRSGVNQDVAMRAADAYRRTLNANDNTMATALGGSF
ncbi:MAG TPA: hypothetical protein VHZ78_12035 [Rhizomicrobium sp.]|jgi:hypothetical protein|nr:hypothetical protein [Rhizomicrobium sp.]